MLEFVPDLKRMTEIFSQATAPTFFLGAIAGFVSLMSARLNGVVDRIRALNRMEESDERHRALKADLARLRKRAKLLSSAILWSLIAGICATVLLGILFGAEFASANHAYGTGLLFMLATTFLGFALVRFAQEARIGLAEADEYD